MLNFLKQRISIRDHDGLTRHISEVLVFNVYSIFIQGYQLMADSNTVAYTSKHTCKHHKT